MSEIKKIKQVIVMRTDLNMRKGKMVAQGAHASLKAILDLAILEQISPYTIEMKIEYKAESALKFWLEDKFTKICVGVSSEKELLEIYQKAKDNGMICSLIKDAGLTEFDGVATYTCCAIGPAFEEDVNELTGHLKLL